MRHSQLHHGDPGLLRDELRLLVGAKGSYLGQFPLVSADFWTSEKSEGGEEDALDYGDDFLEGDDELEDGAPRPAKKRAAPRQRAVVIVSPLKPGEEGDDERERLLAPYAATFFFDPDAPDPDPDPEPEPKAKKPRKPKKSAEASAPAPAPAAGAAPPAAAPDKPASSEKKKKPKKKEPDMTGQKTLTSFFAKKKGA